MIDDILTLQNILFPQECCNLTNMFFTVRGSSIVGKDSIVCKKSSIVMLNTYFNSFSIAKWKKYTSITNLSCEIEIQGCFDVFICYSSLGRDINTKTIFIGRHKHITKSTTRINLDFGNNAALCYIRLVAVTNNSTFWGGRYVSYINDNVPLNINLALCICTYKREEYLFSNLKRIREKIFDNPYSLLYNHLNVFISDNGQTLPIDKVSSKKIHVYHNKNAGGSGGFTRCILECLFNKNSNIIKPTHLIFTDDDIILMPEVLERTFLFLRLIKSNYKNMFLASSFLELERKNIQFCAGKSSNTHTVIHRKGQADLNNFKNVLNNEKEELITYSGWWYHCIPADYVTESNLPMPFFIHVDDKEYDCRFRNRIITLNGICIWHPSLVNKQPIAIDYYDIRNGLILGTENYRLNSQESVMKIAYEGLKYAFYYDYNRCKIYFKAIRDFFKGVDFFKETEPTKLHSELSSYNYSAVEVPQNIKDKLSKGKIGVIKKRSKFSLLISSFLPAFKKTLYTNVSLHDSALIGYKHVLCFDPEQEKGVLYTKNLAKFIKSWIEYVRINILIKKKYTSVLHEWRDRIDELRTVEFWTKYLELEDDYSISRKQIGYYERHPISEDFSCPENIVSLISKQILRTILKIKKKTQDEINYKLKCYDVKRKILLERKKRKNNLDDLVYSKLLQFKNKYIGKRCFICATGPSMTIDDLEMLKDEYTFGVNGLACIFERTKWRPTFFGVSDHAIYTKINHILKKEKSITVFVGSNAFIDRNHTLSNDWIIYPENYAYHDYEKLYKNQYFCKFSDNPYDIVYDGYTIVYGMIQLAIYMGFKEIYLLGTDCNYNLTDKNHFVEAGNKIPESDLLSAYDRLMCGYKTAKKYLDCHKDIRIFNATRGGMLDIFPRVKLEDILEG